VRDVGTNHLNIEFREMGPNQTAEELLRDLEPGCHVAIAAMRRTKDKQEAAGEYEKALRAKGFIVRSSEGRTGI
jgi:hypothetical protein